MVRLLGPQDRLLTTIEHQYPGVDVHVRGNEITLDGPTTRSRPRARLVDELIALVQDRRTTSAPSDVTSSARILRARRGQPGRGAQPGDPHRRAARASGPKTLGQKAYVDAIDENTIVFGIGPAGTGKTYLAMAKAVQALQRKEVEPHHPDPSGGRGGGAARVPARHADRQDRPVPAPALRRAQRDDGSRARAEAARGRHGRGRAARLHARPHAQQLVRRARRGAEHDARADEDVPHPARLRHADGRHRRHHPDRPAGRARAACGS